MGTYDRIGGKDTGGRYEVSNKPKGPALAPSPKKGSAVTDLDSPMESIFKGGKGGGK